mmetsp:Transcript_116070/g.248241  ORF Transcript_116070/g.248241 Transcript_116070/m.248241 type:complete len:232 (+) Transcript_116070:898-1593(+)
MASRSTSPGPKASSSVARAALRRRVRPSQNMSGTKASAGTVPWPSVSMSCASSPRVPPPPCWMIFKAALSEAEATLPWPSRPGVFRGPPSRKAPFVAPVLATFASGGRAQGPRRCSPQRSSSRRCAKERRPGPKPPSPPSPLPSCSRAAASPRLMAKSKGWRSALSCAASLSAKDIALKLDARAVSPLSRADKAPRAAPPVPPREPSLSLLLANGSGGKEAASAGSRVRSC